MLTGGELTTFLALCVVLALVPGPNLAIVLRNTARGGQPAAWATAAGLTASKAVWAIGSLVGLASILNASATAWSTLRLLGAAYLLYLGVSTLLAQRKGLTAGTTSGGAPQISLAASARSGAFSDLLNPKVGAFYLAVFPQFIGPGDPVMLTGAALLLVHAVVLMSYYPLVAAGSLRTARLAGAGWQRILETGLGAALIGAGAILAADARR
jgi:threonine/homoserine/homoserine lactone efflux protein